MFDNLSLKLEKAFQNLKGQGQITEINVATWTVTLGDGALAASASASAGDSGAGDSGAGESGAVERSVP